MPKIDPRADYRQVKGWANSHVLIAVIIAAVIGFVLGLVLG
jgi:hypothetical protein